MILEAKREKKYESSIKYTRGILGPFAIYIFLILSALISAVIVSFNGSNSNWDNIVFLPITFLVICIFMATFYDLFVKSLFITAISGLYWIRLVLTPTIMCMADYAVVPENRDWEIYLPQAFLLECYEAIVVFGLIAFFAHKIRVVCNKHSSYKSIYYPLTFKMMVAICLIFSMVMFCSWPNLIRYFFVTILGAPRTWYVFVEQRHLGETGEGPLGIFVTLLSYLIVIMQMILPPLVLTLILNKRNKMEAYGYSEKRIRRSILPIAVLLIIITGFIATESRANTVIAATCLLWTLISFSNKKEKKILFVFLIMLFCIVVGALWYKTTYQSALNTTGGLNQFSQVLSEYFAGPQNIAASIQAVKINEGPDLKYIYLDILNHVPYGTMFLPDSLKSVETSTILFNHSLYRTMGTYDQILPSVGQGYFWFGFLFAPLNTAIMVALGIWFEIRARRASPPLYRYILFWGCIWMVFGASVNNLSLACGFLWYIFVSLLISGLTHFYIYTVPGDERRAKRCHGESNG